MKKFLAFLKWHVSKWTVTQRLWMIGAFFFGGGAIDYIETGVPGTSIYIAWAFWGSVFVKWFVWDPAVDSWKKFEGERKDLFKTIDEGK